MFVHQFNETSVMGALQEMRHFVHDDVLQARWVFLGQFDVEPETRRIGIARPPFSFHPSNGPVAHR